ncbi:thioredoxin family protein [Myroides pelagicus]|uniref:Thioredoxin fold domain-containing protein n=1 Tax=Myroides pelagicus TaxID=270914 RepID=A0A7K1GN68_9FLAO|nr:thioredoxin family protein [Myroides pelagicus]MEC4112755.1 thioredoxin family protein [Myroides pelagicus]MTH29654.1 thioredoxin fold domain-containing protein [Myroides pelagicus]
MRCIIFFIFFNCFGLGVYAQAKAISFEQLDELQAIEARPVVVFLYTNWCSYCTLMEQKTFKNDHVINRLNQDFYFIPFNAEQDKVLLYKGKEYALKKRGINTSQHELAIKFVQSNAYPAIVFLDANGEVIYRHFAYLRAKELLYMLGVIHSQENRL